MWFKSIVGGCILPQSNESHTTSGVRIFFHSVIKTILVPSSDFCFHSGGWRAAKLLFGIKVTPAVS